MGRPRSAQITDAELTVLEALWASEPATIRSLTDTLYPGGGTAAYATVQKLLDRLHKKGWVEKERGQVAHQYSSAGRREDLIAGRLQETADRLCSGSLRPLLSALLDHHGLGQEDVAQLEAWLDQKLRDEAEPGDPSGGEAAR